MKTLRDALRELFDWPWMAWLVVIGLLVTGILNLGKWQDRHNELKLQAYVTSLIPTKSHEVERFYVALSGARGEYGLPEQGQSSLLELAAHRRLKDMQTRHYFSHFGPNAIGYAYQATRRVYPYTYSEDLAFVPDIPDAPEAAVQTLLRSPRHREDLLGKWKRIGVACGPLKTDRMSGMCYVVIFGNR